MDRRKKNLRSIPDHLRRNPASTSRVDSSEPKALVSQKNKGNKESQNWRKGDNWRGNDSKNREDDDENQRSEYNKSRTGQNRNFDQNRFKENANEITDDEFITELLSNKNVLEVANALTNTQKFVKIVISNLCDDLLVKIIKLVASLCDATSVTNKNYIIKCIMQQKFVKRLNLLFSMLAVCDDKEPTFWHEFDDLLKNIITILDTVLNLMPMTMWEHVKSIVQNINIVLPSLKTDKPMAISDLAEERLVVLQKDIEKIEKIFKKPEDKINLSEDETENEGSFETSYRVMEVYPDITELTIRDRPYLRKNIVDRPYNSIAQYLDIHFRLLREDFINPIREDICDFISKTNRRLFNIKLYKNAKFLKRVFFQDKFCFKISFNLPDWILKSLERQEPVKRLIHGTMLLFTHDNFNTMICGKVVDGNELREGYIIVELFDNYPHLDKTYLMIECSIFFEPYYQVLSVLKHIHPRSLPMEDYIIHIKKDAKPPRYMENVPIPKVGGLNTSQEAALKAAMSKEFVIIQGPPGTGKTFLGMKLIGEMLKLKQHWQHQGPILIICFTNHALDQFLDGLNSKTQRIARLGGQSTSLMELETKFGPEATVRKIYDDRRYSFDYSEEDSEDEFFYSQSRRIVYNVKTQVINDLKRNTFRYKRKVGYNTLMDMIPRETKVWLREKGILVERFIALKRTESSIKEDQTFIENLDTLRTSGIFKTDFLFNETFDYYYYFTDMELACWLLSDDGTIKTNVETVENMGKINVHDIEDPSKIYSLLSDCLNGRDMTENFTLTVNTLKDYLFELEEFSKLNRCEKGLQDYIKFVKRKIEYLRTCLNTNFDLPRGDIENVNPWTLPSKTRWQLYGLWVRNGEENMFDSLEKNIFIYHLLFNMYTELREQDNVKLLKKMDIVGMTTTCAARMRSTLEALRSPIVVVEEAAEVLESHIVTALTENCQHLILLGDHQQLRPATSDYTIEKNYKLGISLFERMVNNKVECHTLNVQHRMRPEISKLLKPTFYKDLEDSKSVTSYPMINGVTCPLFFIDHTEPEEPYGDSSKMNMHEAKFLIKLAIYLINNDYRPTDITILAAYLGQTYVLKEERGKSNHPLVKDVHITPVDNFQGEENKIILLSLVRSNADNNIGFLKVDNRVCVALSRAKEGFYMMGNMVQLCASSEIWKPIKASLESQKAIGLFLSLRCRNHSKSVTLVSKPSDFDKVPDGGCGLQCSKQLTCGHRCKRKCHGYDVDHLKYICDEPCKRSLCDIPEHECKKLCNELCGNCYYLIEVQHNDCKHTELVECFTSTKGNFGCMVKVEKELPCGHKGMVPCHIEAKDFQCSFDVEVQLTCDHSVLKKCYQDVADVNCNVKCQTKLKCGHVCRRDCHKHDDPQHVKIRCLEPCLKTKVGCNHPDEHPKCELRCGDTCEPCKVVTLSSQTCTHVNQTECYKERSVRCQKNCNKKLSCGHTCTNKCSESCRGPCGQKTFKTIPECGHRIRVKCSDSPAHAMCKERCSKLLPCGHNCRNPCTTKCTEKCIQACTKKLDCAHRCLRVCSEPCACKREKYPECDHQGYVKCGDTLKKDDCQALCHKQLECGHRCLQKCGEHCKCTNRYCDDLKNTSQTQLGMDDYQQIGGLVNACFDLKKGPIRPDLIASVARRLSEDLKKVKSRTKRDKIEENIQFIYRKADYLRDCLNKTFQPSKIETASVNKPSGLTAKQRWELYNDWLCKELKDQEKQLEYAQDKYQQAYSAYSHLREEDNITLLKEMDIVGMTTTCAARMRSTLEELQNPIVVVEEAAEVLESHIVTALTENCQQLVLLGDHKQLRPTTADHMIEKKLKLGVSLFERMINNHVQCFTLNVQHRMRPEFSKLVRPLFYKDLKDHESVTSYPSVVGVNTPLYFIDHNEPEQPYGDSSKMNPHESKFLIQLAVYLLNNDYKPSEITILAAYLGQAYTLKQERDSCCHPLIKDVHITPVDNFQGEENKIILLSLVRSNVDNNIGFLSIDNRVCVALSRAKEGLYIMGNMSLLCSATEIWKPIKIELESQKALGKALSLCCRNHKEHVTQVSKPSDFSLVPEGGCQFDCNTPLICGHNCQLKCHGYDLNHEKYKCKQPCTKSICDDPQHVCKKQCYNLCGLCYYMISKTLPCGHNKVVKCLTPIENVRCQELVQIEPECGHIQEVECHRVKEFVCTMETIKLLMCGHEMNMSCDKNIEGVICTFEEEVELPCEHKFRKKCHVDILNVKCMVEEEVELSCGHKFLKKCHMSSAEVSCMFKEEIELKCSHKVLQQCSQRNITVPTECDNICGKELPCGHKCRRRCHKLQNPKHESFVHKLEFCQEPCTKSNKKCNDPENHPKCRKMCSESCDLCSIPVHIFGENCSHISIINCWEEKDYKCKKMCCKPLPCGHYCKKPCYSNCGECEVKCRKKLSCGHPCSNLCGKPCSTEECIIGDCIKKHP